MITHFAELELPTVSIEGVKQVYSDALGFQITERTEECISFRISELSVLSFREQFTPLAPVHFALGVPHNRFQSVAEWIRTAGLPIARWPNGNEIDIGADNRRSMYFRDGDGNLLEIIAHEHIPDRAFLPTGPMNALYLREVGFPVQSVPTARTWLQDNLAMTSAYPDNERFDFLFAGSAYLVTVSTTRPWVPIAMKALRPDMRLVLGTPTVTFIADVVDRLERGGHVLTSCETEISFRYDKYLLGLRHVPDVPVELSDPDIAW